jgi:hypothetical protein
MVARRQGSPELCFTLQNIVKRRAIKAVAQKVSCGVPLRVHVDDCNAQAFARREGCGQIHSHGGLSYATLLKGDSDAPAHFWLLTAGREGSNNAFRIDPQRQTLKWKTKLGHLTQSR